MKLFATCLLQFGFLLPLAFASLSAKPVAGTLASKQARSSNSCTKAQPAKARKDNSNDSAELLASILPAVLVRVVIEYYFDADEEVYPVIVSARNWLLKGTPHIAVDNTKAYLVGESVGIVGVDHLLGATTQLFNPYWSSYRQFSPSQDGRYFLLSYALTIKNSSVMSKAITSLYAQSDEHEDARPMLINFGGEHCNNGIMSRDGRTVCSYDAHNRTTRVYRIAEKNESGKRTSSLKRELRGNPVVVSGRGNRVAVKTAWSISVYDIDMDTRALLSLAPTGLGIYALNGDGSEIAFITYDTNVCITTVDGTRDTVTISAPNSTEHISRLMYADGGRLYALYAGGQISLVDPKAKKFVPLRVPQAGEAIKMAISPNANYIATLESVDDGEAGQRHSFTHHMAVRRKLSKLDCKALLGIQ